MIICLGLSSPTGSSGLSRDTAGYRTFCPLFGLAPDGVYMAIPVAWMPVSSYLTFPPLRIKSSLFMRGISLLHCPWSRLHWVLPSTLPCGARTFLVCLTAAAIIWLPHLSSVIAILSGHKSILPSFPSFVKVRFFLSSQPL